MQVYLETSYCVPRKVCKGSQPILLGTGVPKQLHPEGAAEAKGSSLGEGDKKCVRRSAEQVVGERGISWPHQGEEEQEEETDLRFLQATSR